MRGGLRETEEGWQRPQVVAAALRVGSEALRSRGDEIQQRLEVAQPHLNPQCLLHRPAGAGAAWGAESG